MTDIWRKPSKGDPLTFPAELRAKMIDTIKDVERLKRASGANIDRMNADRGVIRVMNESGTLVSRFGVLGLDGIITGITPTDNLEAWQQRPVFSGIDPDTPDHYGNFCVVLEPIADDNFGFACVSGVVPVQVSFTYSDEPYADVKVDDEAKLIGAEGGMPVLYKEAGTGTKWALVQMGVPHYPILYGKLDGDLNSNSTATMSVWDGATLADTTRNVTIRDWAFIPASQELDTGVRVTAAWKSGNWYLLTAGDCPIDQ